MPNAECRIKDKLIFILHSAFGILHSALKGYT